MTEGAIAAVVPVFHPERDIVALVAGLARQVPQVVVVVDGPDALDPGLRPAIEDAGATLVDHAANRGIAAALNTGIEAATSRAPVAVLTVDQDSSVPRGYVDALVGAWARAGEAGRRVGLVAPEHIEGLPDQKEGRVPVQSGLLIPAATLRSVGGFDESLFIDGVDADYALRVLDTGLAIVVARGVQLGHRLGDTHTVRVAGRGLELTRSADFRYYYLMRNRLRLLRRHVRRHPAWAVGQSLGLAGHLALVQTFVPGRRARATQVRRGIRDGLRRV